MKTQNRKNHVRIALTALCLVVLFVNSSCQPKKGEQKTADTKVADVDIHTAVITGNLDALKKHIAGGTNINEKDPFGGSSPLITAALFGKTEEAKMLLDAGADINFQNNEGSTALHVASFFCRPEIVKMLLGKGADKSIKNKYGATAYESVAGPFADTKNVYDMIGQALQPMGLKLDYAYIEKTRPTVAAMLK